MTKLGTIRKIIAKVNDAAWAATCISGLLIVTMDIVTIIRSKN